MNDSWALLANLILLLICIILRYISIYSMTGGKVVFEDFLDGIIYSVPCITKKDPNEGDIYEMLIDDYKVFFMVIGKDETNLDADLFKIFKRKYSPSDTPTIKEIVEIEDYVYQYSFLNIGKRGRYWKKYGHFDGKVNKHIWLRCTLEGGEEPLEEELPRGWTIQLFRGSEIHLRRLPRRHYNDFTTIVVYPKKVKEQIKSGEWYAETFLLPDQQSKTIFHR